ncbi:MAG: hypothetical protein ACRBC3_19035 [Burkholderiaceae bacterium]
MLEFSPTKPARTDEDREAARLRQRRWRKSHQRIDYHPSSEAMGVICGLEGPGVGNDRSSIINRAVLAWANQQE